MSIQKLTLLYSIPFRVIFNSIPQKKYLFLFGIGYRLPLLATPVLFGFFISTLSKGITNNYTYMIACGVLVLDFIALFLSWENEHLSIKTFSEQELHLKKIAWTHIQNLPTIVRDSSSNGIWMQKLSRDVPVVSGTCRMMLETGLSFIVFFFGTFSLVIWKAPSVSFIFILAILLTILLHQLFRRKLAEDTREIRESIYCEGDTVLSLLEMLPILNIFRVTHLFNSLFVTSITKITKSQIKQQMTMADFKVLIQIEIWLIHSVVLLICTYLFMKGGLKIGDIVMYDMLISQTLNGLSQVMIILPQLSSGLEYAKSLKEALYIEKSFNDNDGSYEKYAMISERECKKDVSNYPVIFNIEAVTFRYSSDKPPVISDFTANIHNGEFICFLGRNGTGKSTLAKLLVGAYRPESGIIYSSDPRPAIVPQHIVVYRDTLLENVRLRDNNISESVIATMLRQCGFQHFLDTHPLGLHTILSPGSLSGGELQILGIIRALVRNPKTLILDELTNNLDIVAKEAVYSVLTGLRGQSTIILITHDTSCIELADRVFIFHRDGISEIFGSDSLIRTNKALEIIREEVRS